MADGDGFRYARREVTTMPSDYESFFALARYAVVGHSAKKPFPRLTLLGLQDNGKTAYAVDPSARVIEGKPAYADLASLPGPLDAVVLEVPKEESADWVKRAADAGVKDVWIHQGRDTPEAVSLAKDKGIHLRTGTCAVMYLRRGLTYHSIHRLIYKALGKY
jgi:predicted CoA-binding protein